MLKNSDGTPYKLPNYNKLVATQDNPENVIRHNFNWQEESLGEEGKKKPIKKYKEPIQPEIPSSPSTPEPKPEPQIAPVVVPEPVHEPYVPESQKKPQTDLSEFNPVLVHCLPVGLVQKTDFYGDVIVREEYLPKFSFEAIVLKDDVEILFWTNATKININSIVYPSKYVADKQPYARYEWWKVIEVVEKNGGYLIKGAISDTKPDFT